MEQKKTLLNKPYFNSWSYEDLLNMASSQDEIELLYLDKAIREMMKKNKAITYTQLRSVLTEIKKEPLLSKNVHKLAYIQARQEKKEAIPFVEFIRELMVTAIENNKKEAFKEILNTIVAYHKFFGKN